jgi:hypothetical protein
MRAGIDRIDHRTTQVARRHVRPVFAIVTRDMNETIVTANPDLAIGVRRRCN